MTVALLFPGQGSKGVLAGLELATSFAEGRSLVERAAAAAGVAIEQIAAQGGRALDRTEVLQPVLTAIALAAHRRLRAAGVRARAVAGHSLGEIAAWCAAGAIAPEDAVEIAALRGRLMAREAARRPGGLLALLDGTETAVRAAIAIGKKRGAIDVGAVNAPDEVVLTGDDAALRAVAAALPSRRLPVAGAWHGPAMAGAVEELRTALHALPRRPLEAAFVSNRDGAVLDADRAGEIPDRLADQIACPVEWARSLATLADRGVNDFITVSPGAVLRGLARKSAALTRARVHGTEDARDLARTLEALGGPG
ncbi:ACP S-malonyltransferase [Sorangium sp. So ce145]|uniref:ACP S-malonyltransferase n=1 Tax=Sorangium sp. So ce145 TaxID=3133285 RepID=UPI003F5D613B